MKIVIYLKTIKNNIQVIRNFECNEIKLHENTYHFYDNNKEEIYHVKANRVEDMNIKEFNFTDYNSNLYADLTKIRE